MSHRQSYERFDRRAWAVLGAQTRLAQLEQEIARIKAAFPGIKSAGGSLESALIPAVRPKRMISAAARRAMSEGMRKFWARRKALDKK